MKTARWTLLVALTTALSLSAAVAVAAPGDLDPSYGGGAPAIVDLGGHDQVVDMAVQPDGKTLVLLLRQNVGANLTSTLVRFDTDGSLDDGFGSGGVVEMPPGALVSAMALHEQRILVMAGFATSGDTPSVVLAFDSSGAIDESFGSDGATLIQAMPMQEMPVAAEVAPGGALVIAVESIVQPDRPARVVRLLADGTVDPSFGTGGISTPDLSDANVSDVLLTPGGGIVLAAMADDAGGGSSDLALGGLLNDGSPDPSFQSGRHDTGGDDRPGELALDAAGRILLSGLTDVAGPTTPLVARFQSDGSPDASFGQAGVALVDVPTVEPPYSVPVGTGSLAIQPEGRIVTAAHGPDGVHVAALTTSGAVDTSFGSNGFTSLPLRGGVQPPPRVELAPEDRLMLATSAEVGGELDVATVRLLLGGSAPDPDPDPDSPGPDEDDQTRTGPDPPGDESQPDRSSPRLFVAGLPVKRACLRGAFNLRILAIDRASGIARVGVRVDRRRPRVARRRAERVKRLRVVRRIDARRVSPGLHRIVVRAVDGSGNAERRVLRFRSCG